jgi:hypothetical protein
MGSAGQFDQKFLVWNLQEWQMGQVTKGEQL